MLADNDSLAITLFSCFCSVSFCQLSPIFAMGTLTAECPRLDAHCPHKLATSCRLTSTPSCCACADERVHSRLYRVYIDGVGYVQRGTRWQSYCWFCKGELAPKRNPCSCLLVMNVATSIGSSTSC